MAHVRERGRQSNWLPLRQAVFQFGRQDEGDSADPNHSQPPDLTQTEVTWSSATFSLEELEKLLEETAHARDAQIDPVACTFSFSFDYGDVTFGPPWVILENPSDKGVKVNPRVEAEALFNKEGLVYIADDEGAAFRALQLDAIRHATGLVWRQFMLRDFDRAVSAQQVMFRARIGSTSEPIKQFDADVWPVLEVLDWDNGMACDPQGVPYYSIHATRVITPSKKSHSPQVKKNLLQQAQEKLEAHYKTLEANGPKPTEPEDEKYLQKVLGQSVSRDDVLRPARRRAFYNIWHIELKRGRR